MGKTEVRENLLMSELQRRGKMSINDIAECFSVSEPTARRMASSVASKKKALRTHGGLRYLPNADYEYSFDALEHTHVAEKQKIAAVACELIEDGDIVFLEAGTTIQYLAIALAEKLRNKELKSPIIFTNSLNNLTVLSPLCKVTVIGGEYRPDRRDFSGYICERMIKGLRFNKCFVGTDAINLNEGVMASDIETVRFDELLITRSEKAIILADSSKFGRLSFVEFAGLADVSAIITDDGLPAATAQEYLNLGVNLIRT